MLLVAAGLLAGRELLTAAALAPFGLIGLLAGSRIHLKLSREQFARFVAGLVIMAGLSLIARSLLG